MGFFDSLTNFLSPATDFIGSPAGGLLVSGVGGILGANAAGQAADAQVAGSQAAIAEQRRQFDLIRADLAPFQEQGVNALNQFAGSVLGPLEATPAFQFQLEQGVNALDRSAAARGKLLSGQQVKAVQQFGQGLASNEANNQLNRLAGLAGVGQTATTAGGQFGAGASANISNALINAGTQRASGFVGQSNAINDSLNNFLLFNALR